MNCFNDKLNQKYLGFVGGFCVLLVAIFLIVGWQQGVRIRNSLFQWERMVSSSLLENGVSKGIVAEAFVNQESSLEGDSFLRQIGHTEDISPVLYDISKYELSTVYLYLAVVGAGLILILFAGTIFYLEKRERAFAKATGIIEKYAAGDYSERLASNNTGNQQRLFRAVDGLATALQAKSEAEYKGKQFLKDTISDISHQLKTPLAALNMYTEIISSEPDEERTVREFASKSVQSLARMERLIYLLLKVTRLDAGSVNFNRKPVKVQEIVHKSAEDLFIRAKQEEKELLFEGNTGITLYCDEDWTVEAIGNLLKNGLDHTKRGGTVCISWSVSPAMLRIDVKDNGSGIQPEDIHHIFKRFYRSRNSLDTQGIGLGLPLAKSIIEGQGGVLSVESEPGQGTVFHISFLNNRNK